MIVRNKKGKKRENCKGKGRITTNGRTIVSREIQKSEIISLEEKKNDLKLKGDRKVEDIIRSTISKYVTNQKEEEES